MHVVLSIVAGVLRVPAARAQDAGVAPADESVGNPAQAVADTNRAPGVAVMVEIEGPDRTAVFEVIVDRSPATMALPAVALPFL
jgi:hypothetical protein